MMFEWRKCFTEQPEDIAVAPRRWPYRGRTQAASSSSSDLAGRAAASTFADFAGCRAVRAETCT